MLPCQQSMMIDEALEFERLVVPSSSTASTKSKNKDQVQNSSTEFNALNITWENPGRYLVLQF